MATEGLEAAFARDGYVVVRGALAPEEVASARAAASKAFEGAAAGKRQIFPAETFRIPEFYRAMVKPRIIEALKIILEPSFSLFPDLVVHRNMFGYSGRGGWHTDCNSELGADYLVDPDYRFVKCGVYLQDNTVEWGGGIDVAPGWHRFPFGTWTHPINYKAKHWLDKLGSWLRGRRVEIAAGDFVFFDSRLPHTSTWPRAAAAQMSDNDHLTGIPDDKTKFVIYWNAARSRFVDSFLEHSARRATREELAGKTRGEVFFADYLRYRFPADFPPEFVAAVNAAGVKMAGLTAAAAREWQAKYAQARAGQLEP